MATTACGLALGSSSSSAFQQITPRAARCSLAALDCASSHQGSSRSRKRRSNHSNNEPDEYIAGQANHRLQRSVRREDRISTLQKRISTGSPDGCSSPLSIEEEKELDGLMRAGLVYEEQYSVVDFTESHLAWKAMHNDVFVSLAKHCQKNRNGSSGNSVPINVFYLDGPDAATTFALLDDGGFESSQCYVANRHESTCDALRSYLPDENVVHASAADALTSLNGAGYLDGSENEFEEEDGNVRNIGAFGKVPFGAYYFDGCGGYTPLIVDMMSAAFDGQSSPIPTPPIAVGFSILGGNRDVVDKEQTVMRELVALVKPHGLRVDHVLDDPGRYGLSSEGMQLRKVDGGTMTTWCMLETDSR